MSPIDRRRFLSGSLLGAAGGLVAGAGLGGRPARADDNPATPGDLASAGLVDRVPYDGPRQAGILTPAPAQAAFLALDSVAGDRNDLRSVLQALSYRARQLAEGGPYAGNARDEPPLDSGILGPDNAPDALTVTIGLGASLFDHRYGLAGRRPARLTRMPAFPDDDLDPAQSHGDVLVQVCAGHRDTVVHTVRELLRAVHGAFELRWTVDGFMGTGRGPTARSAPRNLFAFRDGTANPDGRDAALMDRLVWTPEGGTYQVIRLIRMHVEFWDRVGLREQENMIGRARDSGAPLGGKQEGQDPRYDLDPRGRRIPLDAHIRLANPRTAVTADERLLRRPYNYSRGFDSAGTLDQGMVFVAFNRDPEQQFAAVQRRLRGEPMTDYITPVGGGYFYVPPGTGGRFGWIGQTLLA